MITALLLLTLAAPGTVPPTTTTMTGESFVLAGTAPAKFLAPRVDPASVVVRTTYDSAANATIYESGKDYVVDAAAGTIARTAGSRIPDFTKNMLFGKRNFDHSSFPGYGNLAFTVYVDYASSDVPKLTAPTDQSGLLKRPRAKLEAGGPFKLIAFGDSIAAGGDASTEALRFQNRYAAHLAERFPKAAITVENGATGGDNAINGAQRLEAKVLSRGPDLVLIGFGMNDHNRGGPSPAEFQANLEAMVKTVRERSGADVILFSAFPPHPDWAFGTHRMHEYAAATKAAADSTGTAYADVYSAWMKVLERKDPASLLANNINHPNDFGHWIYAEALRAVGF